MKVSWPIVRRVDYLGVFVRAAIVISLMRPGVARAQSDADGSTSEQPVNPDSATPSDSASPLKDLFTTETVGPNNWRLVVSGPGALRLSLTSRNVPGEILRIYGPDGALVGKSSGTGLADEEVALDVTEAGTYVVRVEGTQEGNNSHRLVVTGRSGVGATAPPPAGPENDSVPALIGPAAPFRGSPAVALNKVSPAPGTLLPPPLAGLEQALKGRPVTAPLLGEHVTADVSYDTGGKPLFVGLMDRDAQPAVIGPGLTAGAGSDAALSIEPVSGVGTAHLIAGTLGLFAGDAVKTTRLRVRLCEPPADEPDGQVQIGQCYAEALSGDYPVQQK